jgi:hypothetical protein
MKEEEVKEPLRFCVVLRSKHTGKEITLGSTYATREEAQAYADKECCAECNGISIRYVYPDSVWIDKEAGFGDRKMRELARKVNK